MQPLQIMSLSEAHMWFADPTCGMISQVRGWFCQSPGKSCKAGPWQTCAILQAVHLLTLETDSDLADALSDSTNWHVIEKK